MRIIMKTTGKVTLVSALMLLAFAQPTAVADDERTGPEWWQKECERDWKISSAYPTCRYQGEAKVKHVGIENHYNMCEVKAKCQTGDSHFGTAIFSDTEYRGRNVDIRDLHNCEGSLQVGPCEG